MLRSARGRVATLLLPVGAIVLSTVAAASPVRRPHRLRASCRRPTLRPTSRRTILIGSRRSTTPRGRGRRAMDVSEPALGTLPIDQQVLTVVNEERVDRGDQPIDYVTRNSTPSAGRCERRHRPGLPIHPDRWRAHHLRRIGLGRWPHLVLEADYYWMYDDGWGGSATSNAACSASNPSAAGATATSSCTSSPAARPGRRCSRWARPSRRTGYAEAPSPPLSSARARRRPTSRPAGASWPRRPGRVRGPSPSRRRPTARGYWEVEANGTVGAFGSAAELRLAQRPAQRAHRRHGVDAGRQGVLAGRHGRRRSSASATLPSTARPARCA